MDGISCLLSTYDFNTRRFSYSRAIYVSSIRIPGNFSFTSFNEVVNIALSLSAVCRT